MSTVSVSTARAFDGIACGHSSSNINMQECGDCKRRLSCKAELAVWKVFVLKSRITPCSKEIIAQNDRY